MIEWIEAPENDPNASIVETPNFSEFYNRFKHQRDHVERLLAAEFATRKELIKNNNELSYMLLHPTENKKVFKIFGPPDDPRGEVHIVTPLLQIIKNGEVVFRKDLEAQDINYLCEHGSHPLMDPLIKEYHYGSQEDEGEDYRSRRGSIMPPKDNMVESHISSDSEHHHLKTEEMQSHFDVAAEKQPISNISEILESYQTEIEYRKGDEHKMLKVDYKAPGVEVFTKIDDQTDADILRQRDFPLKEFYGLYKKVDNQRMEEVMLEDYKDELGPEGLDEIKAKANSNSYDFRVRLASIALSEAGGGAELLNRGLTFEELKYICLNGFEDFVNDRIQLNATGALAENPVGEEKEDSNIQRTFIMVKPDGVKRGRIGQIIKRFEKRGLRLKELRLCRPPQAKFEEHYAEHKGKPFFPPLLEYMDLGPVVQMVVEGPFAIQICRQMIGKTRPHESDAGTIRGDNGLKMRRNVIHGSDSVEGAEREIGVWFSDSLILEPPAAQ